jgi:biotin transport system substrate-specific component
MDSSLLSLRSRRPALVDRLREEHASALVQAMGVAGFALLTVLAAKINVHLYFWEVPITLQTAVVYASGLYLGWRNGLLAQALYVLMGMVAPVYAGDGYGPQYLLGAMSAGYLLSYPAAAAITGMISRRWKSLPGSTLATLAGAAVLFTGGVVWLHYAAGHATWFESIDKGFLRFVAIDGLKILTVALLYSGTRYLSGERAGDDA